MKQWSRCCQLQTDQVSALKNESFQVCEFVPYNHVKSNPHSIVLVCMFKVLYADRVVINKMDLMQHGVDDPQYILLKTMIQSLNPRAEIAGLSLSDSTAPSSTASKLDVLLDIGGFDLDAIGGTLATEVNSCVNAQQSTAVPTARRCTTSSTAMNEKRGRTYTQHDDDICATSITIPGVMSAPRLERWMKALLDEQGANIYRMKGICDVSTHDTEGTSTDSPSSEVFRLVYQAVHMRFQSDVLTTIPDKHAQRGSKVVLIGRGLNADDIRAGFERCVIAPN